MTLPTGQPAQILADIAQAYWEGILRRNPVLATFFGDYRYNDRLPNLGAAGRAEEEADLRAVLGRLASLDQTSLAAEDRITSDMLRLAAQFGLDGIQLRLDEMAVDQLDGPQIWLPDLLNWHPTETAEQVTQLIARFRAFGDLMQEYLSNLEDGIRDRRIAPSIAVERVIAQVDALLATAPEDSAMSAPAARQPAKLAQQWRMAVRDDVYPAFRRMREVLLAYLTRHARQEPGVWAVADGAQIYALLSRQHTTTELTPDELHAMGQEDLVGIHQEMRAIMARRGDGNLSIREFTERLTRQAANVPASRDELIHISEQLLSAARAALPRAFGRLPRVPVVVKAVEEFRERDAPAAYYFQADADGSRPAVFYINTFEPHARPKHTLPALAFHEALPGHHLQIALAQETAALPAFRRLSAGWLANAFVEGWALYAERLADELGLYPDELARFGMLAYQAWRACRLIVDTGLHHLRWGRLQAIEFLFDNVGLTERETVNEVDRYIVWPGQALAYKVGQRRIEALRRQAEKRWGSQFNLPAFHDALLSHAAVPLSTLASIVADWSPSRQSSG